MRPVTAITGTSVLLAAALLAACGQKGDLYFPDREREVITSVATAPAGDDDEDDTPVTPAPGAGQ